MKPRPLPVRGRDEPAGHPDARTRFVSNTGRRASHSFTCTFCPITMSTSTWGNSPKMDFLGRKRDPTESELPG